MSAQIKSKQRVRNFGEVFTPGWLVSDMVDLVEPDISKPGTRVLEPSCGDGNFLVEVLKRKLANCCYDFERLRAIGSLYAVELLPDNVVKCRDRLMEMLPENLQMQ